MVSTRALETAYLYEFWTFLVLGVWGAFLGCFWGPKNTPLDVSVLGGLASESAAAAYLCDKLYFEASRLLTYATSSFVTAAYICEKTEMPFSVD